MSTDLLLINAIVGIVIPALVALLTKAAAPDWVKAVVNLLLAAIAGVLTPMVASGTDDIDWKVTGLTILQVFVLSVVAHYGLLKPTGLTGGAGVISQAVPGGVGPTDPVKVQTQLVTSPLAQDVPPAGP
jgi:hypothetical protein